MPKCMTQVSYSHKSVARILEGPENRNAAE